MKVVAIVAMLFAVAGCTAAGNGGATGAAPERYMGERPNVNGTWNGSTSSSSMLMQRMKQENAQNSIKGATGSGAATQY